MKAERPRGILSVVLVVLGGLLLADGIVAFYARSQIIDQEKFANRAVEALESPLLETVVDTVLELEPFREVFRQAALQANRVLFVRERDNVAFDISDASEVVKFALQQFAPQPADQVFERATAKAGGATGQEGAQ